MTNRDLTSQFLMFLATTLGPAGFHRIGRRFRRSIGDTVQIIELQKSTSSTSAEVRLRLNLGSFLVPLGPPEALEGTGPQHSECHWRDYLDPQPEADWWTLTSDADVKQVSQQLAPVIAERVLPEMDELSTVTGFLRRWQAGRGTGITKKQQARYLAQLTGFASA